MSVILFFLDLIRVLAQMGLLYSADKGNDL